MIATFGYFIKLTPKKHCKAQTELRRAGSDFIHDRMFLQSSASLFFGGWLYIYSQKAKIEK
jgi:hypothetical protein